MKLATCPIMEGPHWPSSAARRCGRIERLIETGGKRKDKERPFKALISYRDATCSNIGGNRNRNRNGICGNNDSAGSCDSIDGWCATNNSISGISISISSSSSSNAGGCCTSGLNLIIQSGGLSDGPPCRPNNHNTEILIEKLSDTNRIKLTKMHRVEQRSQLRAKWCLGLMLTLVTLVAGLAPSISLGSAAAAVVVPVGFGRHQKAPLLPPTPAAILINLGNANNDTNSQKISLAQSDFKRSTLNDTTANQLLMTGRASGALFKTMQEPLSAALTTLSVATSSPKGALERQVTPAISSQPVDPMLTAASKKKKKKMMKKKKMEKKHKEWKKGKKHKKKKYESKKKKGGSSKKKKGKKEKKKWGMEKKGHKKKGNFKKKKWGSKKKMKKGHKKGKKGHKKLMDKGHKKKGFKKIYHKEEWGKKKKWHDIKREKKWNTKNKKWKKKWHQEKGKKYKGKHMKKYHKKNKHGKKYKKEKKSKWKKHKGEKFKKGHKKKKEEYSKKKEGGKKKKMKKMKEMKKKKKG